MLLWIHLQRWSFYLGTTFVRSGLWTGVLPLPVTLYLVVYNKQGPANPALKPSEKSVSIQSKEKADSNERNRVSTKQSNSKPSSKNFENVQLNEEVWFLFALALFLLASHLYILNQSIWVCVLMSFELGSFPLFISIHMHLQSISQSISHTINQWIEIYIAPFKFSQAIYWNRVRV